MNTHIQQYLKSLDLNEQANSTVIQNVKDQMGFKLPEE
jgi:hypothetical protein